MATVSLSGVEKIYDNRYHAIHDLSLEIKDKEFLVLVGPSGCGKSTALRMVAGLESISGGQRQRVAMGRAIVRQPAAFLMDEPLSNLDAKLRVQMRAEIAALQRDLAVTTIYVTHDQVEAMTMGDRVAVLKDGYLQQVDTPQNLYDRPDNVFVGAFIGSPSMNLYEGQIDISGDGGSVTFGSHRFSLDEHVFAARPGLKGYDGKPVIIGIRPEDFEDAAMVEGVPDNRRLTSRVSLIESLGSEVMAHFRLDAKTVDSGDPDVVEESTSGSAANAVGRFSPRTQARIGENIDIAVAIENIHFFDAGTRKAIWT
ncbi:MAG: ATP-binding cassette domain-containing protein [Ilumatobacter sp.]|nr:ATP-binding cassette domain-containing protein [Ilumatobacter sp.]